MNDAKGSKFWMSLGWIGVFLEEMLGLGFSSFL
jgi:hypothetical protein